MDALIPVLFAAVVGFAHAFEADHLLAVSNIVTKRNSLWLAIKDGIAWGLGHTSTIFLVGLLIIGFKVAISEQVFHYLEASVGLVLILLGVFRLYVLLQTGRAIHRHFHLEDLYFWKKQPEPKPLLAPFQHAFSTQAPADLSRITFAPKPQNHRLAYGIGLIHGLAGSGTLVVLVMSQINGLVLSMLYMAIFGLGSIVGMLLASGLFSLPFSQKMASHRLLQKSLTLLSSLLCIGFGLRIIAENLLL
ncbi:MAG: urease accessory protein [Lewinellaceae bacterium]|nr:urease accessory protein [Lewinellaceae bacterium]